MINYMDVNHAHKIVEYVKMVHLALIVSKIID